MIDRIPRRGGIVHGRSPPQLVHQIDRIGGIEDRTAATAASIHPRGGDTTGADGLAVAGLLSASRQGSGQQKQRNGEAKQRADGHGQARPEWLHRRRDGRHPRATSSMRIATWNVNSVRTRLEQVTAWLAQEQPDVLCLQETKVDDPLFPHQPFEALGYTAVISGQKAYNGVAILSRLPLEEVRIGFSALLPQDPIAQELDGQKRVISALVEGIRIVNLYVPNGSSLRSDKYAFKLQWLACLQRYLQVQELEGDPLVMLGDFNIALEARDIHHPQRLEGGIMASEAEREGLRLALADRLHDGFRAFESASGHWSWWDYRSGAWDRDDGWRIDHIYLDEQLMQQATGCAIHKAVRGQEQPSDHAPVMVHLAWPPADEDAAGEDGW